MKVRMQVGMSGTLNGEPYPAQGEVGELPDVVAEKLIFAGLAVKAGSPLSEDEAAARKAEVETRPTSVAEVETAAVESVPPVKKAAAKRVVHKK